MAGQDYIGGIAYPDFFHPEQAPAWITAVAAALGIPAPAAEDSSWCEIGCGQGFGATVLAAANPQMRFTGIDIDPGHVATARRRAEAAGLTNLRFICADIREEMPDAGEYDYVVSHGMLAWVGPEVREAMARAVAAMLKPGGIAAIHYMSEPGGGAFRAFHAVFRTLAHRPDPVGEGLALLSAMRAAKAGFFQVHAHAAQTLDGLLARPPAYVAHEFLNATFEPLTFAQVNGLFARDGLRWVGSATPLENIDAASLPGSAAEVVGKVADPVLRETLKDMACNQAYRYDLFTRLPRLQDTAHLAVLRRQVWCVLPGAPRPGRLQFQSAIGPVEGDARIFGPLLQRLQAGPARFAELEGLAPFARRPGLLNQALQMGLWGRILHPLQPASDTAPAARLNRQLLAVGAGNPPALAAPGLGSGLALAQAALEDLAAGRADSGLQRLTGLT